MNITLSELIDELIDELNRPTKNKEEFSDMVGKHCVVRTYSAGVHIGTVVKKDGTNVLLKDSIRLFKWSGAFTLSEVAVAGINANDSKLSVAVPQIELTQAIELIPTTEAARKSFYE